MLQLAVNQYLESISDTHFVANPDYLEWANVNCLEIAIKRRPKWIWQDTKYFYDHMSINDLIESPLQADISIYLQKPESMNSDFNWSSSHDINSKIGGSIASLVSLDVSANDVVTVSIDMTGMEKQSIDFHAVTEALKTKKINLNTDYIRNIAANKHNVICLVTQYLYFTKKTEMKVSINWNVSEQSGEKGVPEVSISDDGKIHYVKTKSIVFDVGTRLAFDFQELQIHSDGSFDLIDRSEQSSKMVMIPKLPEITKMHKSNVHSIKKVDISKEDEKGDSAVPSVKCSQPQNNDDIHIITRDLLTIATDNKAVLKQLDSFMLASQDASSVDLSIFKENKNASLDQLLKYVGIDINTASTAIVQTEKLHKDIIGQIIMKIEAIYHLEVPYLQNLLSIIDEGNSELMAILINYLQNLKKGDSDNLPNRDRLFLDGKYKLLLLSIGVTEKNAKPNKYFEPVFVLLHSS